MGRITKPIKRGRSLDKFKLYFEDIKTNDKLGFSENFTTKKLLGGNYRTKWHNFVGLFTKFWEFIHKFILFLKQFIRG